MIHRSKDFSDIISRYAAFEVKVGDMISRCCSPWCSRCKEVCCKPEFCRETLESPFLAGVREAYPPVERYCGKKGWLAEAGCALRAGRPPICYEFLCGEIVDAQETPESKYILSVLCRLVTHAGRFAHGRRHIVEKTDMEDLQTGSFFQFEKRLQEAEAAFSIIRSFLRNGVVSEHAFPVLSKILKPARSAKLKVSGSL